MENIEYHESCLKTISVELGALQKVEKTIIDKQIKNKTKLNEKMSQITSKFNEIDNNINAVFSNLDIDPVNPRVNKIDLSKISELENNEEDTPKKLISPNDFKSFKDYIEKEIKNIIEEITYLKNNNEIGIKDKNFEAINKDRLIYEKKEFEATKEIIKEIQNNEKFFITHLLNKIGKEDFDKAIKNLRNEIEKMVEVVFI